MPTYNLYPAKETEPEDTPHIISYKKDNGHIIIVARIYNKLIATKLLRYLNKGIIKLSEDGK